MTREEKLFKKLFNKVGKKDIKTCCLLIIIENKYRTEILNSFKKNKVNIYEMITRETCKLLIKGRKEYSNKTKKQFNNHIRIVKIQKNRDIQAIYKLKQGY